MAVGAWRKLVSETRAKRDHWWLQCEKQDCTNMRRTWRRLWRPHAGIRLQGTWYCVPECFESAARNLLSRVPPQNTLAGDIHHRIPLGLLMLSRGQLTIRQLGLALEAQRNSGRGRMGYWLTELGFATEQQVTAALGLQWACPVLSPGRAGEMLCVDMVPFRLLESFRMLPVQFVAASRVLYVAFCEAVDYTALHAIEQMLDCRTEACLLGDSAMERGLDRLRHQSQAAHLMFESRHDVGEMANTICGYALRLRTDEVRIAACGEYVWARLKPTQQAATDLLFRRPSGAHPEALPAIPLAYSPYPAAG